MEYNKEVLFSLLEQIYDKSDKTKKLLFSPEKINKVIDSIDKDLEIKCIGFIHYIQKMLSLNGRKNRSGVEMQLIELKYTDENLLKYISKKRNIFYSIKKHLIDHNVIINISKSLYFVNPYFISNIPYKEWNKIKDKIKDEMPNKADYADEEALTWASNKTHDLLNS